MICFDAYFKKGESALFIIIGSFLGFGTTKYVEGCWISFDCNAIKLVY